MDGQNHSSLYAFVLRHTFTICVRVSSYRTLQYFDVTCVPQNMCQTSLHHNGLITVYYHPSSERSRSHRLALRSSGPEGLAAAFELAAGPFSQSEAVECAYAGAHEPTRHMLLAMRAADKAVAWSAAATLRPGEESCAAPRKLAFPTTMFPAQ